MGPFKLTAHGGYKFVSKITGQFTKWTAVYFLCSKGQALAPLQLFVTSTVIPLGKHIIRWRADKGGKFTGDKFKAYCQKQAPLRNSLLPTRHSRSMHPNASGGRCAEWFAAYWLTMDFLHFCGGSS